MFKLSIDTRNAAFEGDSRAEVARILRRVADGLERGHGRSSVPGTVADILMQDSNGNTVGWATLTESIRQYRRRTRGESSNA